MSVDRPDRGGARPDAGASGGRGWSLLGGGDEARHVDEDRHVEDARAPRTADGARHVVSVAPPTGDEDDLDRAFGPDTASVGTRTTAQRVRRATGIGLGAIGVAAVIVVVLGVIVGSVQDGVGGIFPRPGAALDRFVADAERIDGVQSVSDRDQTKTAFASYEVQSTVRVSPGLSGDERTAVVDGLRSAAQEASGNGVSVFAVADLGELKVGVSPDAEATTKRLDLARALDDVGGVIGVRCAWGASGPSDDPAAQVVTVETVGKGAIREAIVTKATDLTHRAFPGASVTAVAPGG